MNVDHQSFKYNVKKALSSVILIPFLMVLTHLYTFRNPLHLNGFIDLVWLNHKMENILKKVSKNSKIENKEKMLNLISYLPSHKKDYWTISLQKMAFEVKDAILYHILKCNSENGHTNILHLLFQMHWVFSY